VNNDFLDVPRKFRLDLPITFRDRIDGECWDQHHCTIANAIVRRGATVGITYLERSGVSRTLVRLQLDPAVHRFAKAGQEYRAYLTPSSQAVAAELDDWYGHDVEHKRFKRSLARQASALPEGLDAVWLTITLVAPPRSRAKGYRAGGSGKSSSRTSPMPGVPNRRYNGYWPQSTTPTP
jgi:hypothetical protein